MIKANHKGLKKTILAAAVGQILIIATSQAAVLTVNTASDDDSVPMCTLRKAIETINNASNRFGCTANVSSNQLGTNDRIEFSSTFFSPRTITLSDSRPLTVTTSVTINGPSEERLTIDGADSSGVIFINGSAAEGDIIDSVDINNLTITGGNARYGAGIFALQLRNLTVSDITVRDNYAYSGGGVFANGGEFVQINNATITGNTASSGAGVRISLINGNRSEINDSLISANSSTMSAGGGVFITLSNSVTISRSQIINNSASRNGAGINFDNSPNGLIQDSTISNNSTMRSGGGISVRDSGNLKIQTSIISDNYAALGGGGIDSVTSDNLNIDRTTVDSNSSNSNGGGIAIVLSGGFHFITASTVSRNKARGNGGGLFLAGSNVYTTLQRSTISGNSAGAVGGGIHIRNGAFMEFFSNTINRNSALAGGGLYVDGSETEAALVLDNVIANSGNGGDCETSAGGTILPQVSNWFEDDSCGVAANGDPRLGGLQDNGGPTRTHAPRPNSGLLGQGTSCQPFDQTGVAIPFNGCTIGAVENAVEDGSMFVVPLPSGEVVIFEL